ncbi:uncharacterized protein F4822DRAFT_434643 [Hypoxylon trugodes]|uniref:uncharacterized protein n=1 Tax=Hypoxylon trugodes TaxID=326681 RepID=UPI00218ED5B6|nr:uncharacterized protein F4822DRAFT_434643 [Hypoxylon trugodes]KAI1383531.1 hypothetical protein F4822DRAFT_434643 [Hypoxylon trugodes]
MNKPPRMSWFISTLAPLNSINPTNQYVRLYSSSVWRRPKRRHTAPPPPVASPCTPGLLAISPEALEEVKASMSNETWHKSMYSWFLDKKIQGMELDEHLQLLRQEHTWLIRRYEQIVRREAIDVGCETALRTLKQLVNWRIEVVWARTTEIEAYRDGLKSAAKEVIPAVGKSSS